ncbi:hypothetical protein PB2503_09404 [Parvularcula bermudensis HTCC2503]|uniref:BioF2-like acetyltransferase domain-containing protein n=1 Tax=Parvularcula bermudensis (strain ATCC BAA-594 / HTCC2503 / KCTC 12087) TaxID=314260 RepID=E0TDB1_PARBH|nr:hypothetical protein PB2503_09404 [Parvularcula bermudensis HTCC2503]
MILTITVRMISKAEITPSLRGAWRDLADKALWPNPFFRPGMLEAALIHLDPTGTVHLLVVEEGGEWLALMPVRRRRGIAKLPLAYLKIWQPPHMYNGTPLVRRGALKPVRSALAAWLDGRPLGARFFRLTAVTEEVAAAWAHLGGSPRTYVQQRVRCRACLVPGTTFDDHLSARYSGKKRKQFRRLAKRLGEEGEMRFDEGPPTPALIETYLTLEAAGWKGVKSEGHALLSDPNEAAFFRAAMATAEEGTSVLTLRLSGAPIALLIILRHGGGWSLFKTTYDEAYGPYSPGVQLLLEATRRFLIAGDAGEGDLYDSCAKPDHTVMNGMWEQRLVVMDLEMSTGAVIDRMALALAAQLGAMRHRLTTMIKKRTHGLP